VQKELLRRLQKAVEKRTQRMKPTAYRSSGDELGIVGDGLLFKVEVWALFDPGM